MKLHVPLLALVILAGTAQAYLASHPGPDTYSSCAASDVYCDDTSDCRWARDGLLSWCSYAWNHAEGWKATFLHAQVWDDHSVPVVGLGVNPPMTVVVAEPYVYFSAPIAPTARMDVDVAYAIENSGDMENARIALLFVFRDGAGNVVGVREVPLACLGELCACPPDACVGPVVEGVPEMGGISFVDPRQWRHASDHGPRTLTLDAPAERFTATLVITHMGPDRDVGLLHVKLDDLRLTVPADA